MQINDFINNAREQAVQAARNLGNNLSQTNTEIAMLNQAIMKKGINGLTPDENKLFQQYYMSPVMGMTSAPSNVQMAKTLSRFPLSTSDRSVMGQFQPTRQAMGQVGIDAQNILEGLGGNPNMSNPTLQRFFNRVVQLQDKLGINPVQDIPKINLGR